MLFMAAVLGGTENSLWADDNHIIAKLTADNLTKPQGSTEVTGFNDHRG